MTDGLSYLGLRCVLEYLEANKRIHITARSPVLQKFEKTIPLYIDRLRFKTTTSHLNDIEYNTTITSGAYLYTNGKTSSFFRIPNEITAPEATKILFLKFLGGREVYVNRLRFSSFSEFNLLATLQLRVRYLDTESLSFRDGYLNVVHPSSFPLMELRTGLKDAEDLNHDVFKSATKLVISSIRTDQEAWFIPNLSKLTNLEIVIQKIFSQDFETFYLGIIQNYLSVSREVGAFLTFGSLSDKELDTLLSAVRGQFNATNLEVKEPGRSPNTPFPNVIKSTSTALVYGSSGLNFSNLFNVNIEIIASDTVIPMVSSC